MFPQTGATCKRWFIVAQGLIEWNSVPDNVRLCLPYINLSNVLKKFNWLVMYDLVSLLHFVVFV